MNEVQNLFCSFLYFLLFFRIFNMFPTIYNYIHLCFLLATAPVFTTCSPPIVMTSPSKELFLLFLIMCMYLCLQWVYECKNRHPQRLPEAWDPWSWNYSKLSATGHDIVAVNWTSILWKVSGYSELLRHLSKPSFFIIP